MESRDERRDFSHGQPQHKFDHSLSLSHWKLSAVQMSWFSDFTPGAEERRGAPAAAAETEDDTNPTVTDASGRQVSTKQANRPFLAYASF